MWDHQGSVERRSAAVAFYDAWAERWSPEADAEVERRMDAFANASRRYYESLLVLQKEEPPRRVEIQYREHNVRYRWLNRHVCGHQPSFADIGDDVADADIWPAVDACEEGRADDVGDKRYCDWTGLTREACVVLSAGCGDRWRFEEAAGKRDCEIHTFDPDHAEKMSVPFEIRNSTTLHRVPLGAAKRDAHTAWDGLVRTYFTTREPTVGKVDVEGHEYAFLADVLDRRVRLPEQLDIELHYGTTKRGFATHLRHLARRLWKELGFALIDKRQGDGGCEITVARLVDRDDGKSGHHRLRRHSPPPTTTTTALHRGAAHLLP